MLDRRRLLAALAAFLLPAPRLAQAFAPAAPAALPAALTPASRLRIVDGWVVTERDLAAIDRLAH